MGTFSHSYSIELSLKEPAGTFLERAGEIVRKMDWKIRQKTESDLLAETSIHGFSMGEMIAIQIRGEKVFLESKSRMRTPLMGNPKNEMHIRKLLIELAYL